MARILNKIRNRDRRIVGNFRQKTVRVIVGSSVKTFRMIVGSSDRRIVGKNDRRIVGKLKIWTLDCVIVGKHVQNINYRRILAWGSAGGGGETFRDSLKKIIVLEKWNVTDQPREINEKNRKVIVGSSVPFGKKTEMWSSDRR